MESLTYARRYLEQVCWLPGDEKTLALPARWSPLEAKQKGVSLADDDVTCCTENLGPSSSRRGQEISILRSCCPVDSSCEVYYYEVQVLELSPQSDPIGIGFCAEAGLPSCIYNSDGSVTIGTLRRKLDGGHPYGHGDVVGYGWYKRNQTIFLTKNGILLGSIALPDAMVRAAPPVFNPYYPCVKLPQDRSNVNCSLRANFGNSSFLFDIQAHFTNAGLGEPFSKFRQDAATLLPDILHLIFNKAVSHEDISRLHPHTVTSNPARFRAYQHAIMRVSMVCRDWYHFGQPLLFKTTLLSELHHITQFRDLIIKSPTGVPLGTLVSDLFVIGPPSSSLLLLLVSSAALRLKTLKALTWNMENQDAIQHLPPKLIAAMPALFQAFISLDSFTLRNYRFPSFRRFSRLVCSLPNLTTLKLADVHWPDGVTTSERRISTLHRHGRLQTVEFFLKNAPDMVRCAPSLPSLFLSPSMLASVSLRDGPVRSLRPSPLSAADALTVVSLIDAFVHISRWCADHTTRTITIRTQQRRRNNIWYLNVYLPDEQALRFTFAICTEPQGQEAKSQMTNLLYSFAPNIWLARGISDDDTPLPLFCSQLEGLIVGLSNFPRLKIRLLLVRKSPEAMREKLRDIHKYMPGLTAYRVLQFSDVSGDDDEEPYSSAEEESEDVD